MTKITMIKKTFSRTASGKSWKANPDEVITEVVSKEFYNNYIASVPFFNNFGHGASCRAYKGYTYEGYIPVKVTSISPYRETKIECRFRFEPEF